MTSILSTATIGLTINGRAVQARPGQTIMEAARARGSRYRVCAIIRS